MPRDLDGVTFYVDVKDSVSRINGLGQKEEAMVERIDIYATK